MNATISKKQDVAGGSGPSNFNQFVEAIKNNNVTGISAEGFVQFFKAVSNASEAVMMITDKASEHQKGTDENINAAISGGSDALETIAQNLETDEARLEFVRLYLDREKEKTKQAKVAMKSNKSNNKFYKKALGVIASSAILMVGIVLKARK